MYREEIKFFSKRQKKVFNNVFANKCLIWFSENKESFEISYSLKMSRKGKIAFFGYVA